MRKLVIVVTTILTCNHAFGAEFDADKFVSEIEAIKDVLALPKEESSDPKIMNRNEVQLLYLEKDSSKENISLLVEDIENEKPDLINDNGHSLVLRSVDSAP